jgi:hypothetical protein
MDAASRREEPTPRYDHDGRRPVKKIRMDPIVFYRVDVIVPMDMRTEKYCQLFKREIVADFLKVKLAFNRWCRFIVGRKQKACTDGVVQRKSFAECFGL